jgi:hypothetical protein
MIFRKLIIIATLSITSTTSLSAAPLSAIAGVDELPATSLIEPVHGCHRSAQDSLEGWHRHVGPYCRAIPSGPSERSPYARCRTRCKYVGPIKQCRQVCDY